MGCRREKRTGYYREKFASPVFGNWHTESRDHMVVLFLTLRNHHAAFCSTVPVFPYSSPHRGSSFHLRVPAKTWRAFVYSCSLFVLAAAPRMGVKWYLVVLMSISLMHLTRAYLHIGLPSCSSPLPGLKRGGSVAAVLGVL